jgi:uncharacterized protein YegJ (DUF2314 family)
MLEDRVIPFSSEDPEMEAAINAARETLGEFLQAFIRPAKNQRSFLLKVKFFEKEHIWMADLDLSSKPSQGTVANEPTVPELKFMQRATFDPFQITDWMYVEDGYLVGGYTTRLIRSRMNSDEREAYDANAPYKFRDQS